MPGGFSPAYARMCEEIGFECFFVSGSQMSAFLLGVPDNGVIGLRDVTDHVRHVAARTTIPIFADADTGFGNVVNVDYAVGELVRSGVAGMQIEDQEWPRTAWGPHRSIPVAEMVGKIKTAVDARDQFDPAFVICARCDEMMAKGGSFESALERCVAYAHDGGADLIWLSAVKTREQLARACREISRPLAIIWGGGGEPEPTREEYGRLGLRIALYPTLAATSGLQGAWEALNDFHERGAPALADFAARAQQSKWGRADFKHFSRNDRLPEIEKNLP
jgi:2-methylisocitrate lyase-like PEP mutase family enzyme